MSMLVHRFGRNTVGRNSRTYSIFLTESGPLWQTNA
uniref:Uncharacterized protein n=1 Tax=Arundo donax TaxID=35708 RepID=A0A0A9AZ32_ARUDO